MLKKITIKKIKITSLALITLFLVYLIPSENSLKPEEELKYVSGDCQMHSIFLLDKNEYVSLTKIKVKSETPKDLAYELSEALIKEKNENIPNGFKAIIPSDTRILNVSLEKRLLKIDFSKEIYEIKKEYEEKMMEALTFTLTSIEGIDQIIVYVEGEILTKLPKTKINLPSTLDRTFGINKEYEFTKLNNINDVTVYYVNENNGNYYYVPVTKYLNDDRDKADIIIDNLSKNYNTNLKSFLNTNTKLEGFNLNDNVLNLIFSNEIYDNNITFEILDEVKETITLSMGDSYNIKEVVFTVDSKEVYKKELN